MHNNYNKTPGKKESLSLAEMLHIIAQKNGCTPKRSGHGYVARCAAHDDRNASLAISQSENGNILIKCYAGCSFAEVCASLDIPMHRMFAKDKEGYHYAR